MKYRCSNCGWLEVNPSGAMFCGYSNERTWEYESCLAWKNENEPKNNADRIRAMTDEELAKWIAKDVLNLTGGSLEMATEAWLDWLKAVSNDALSNP